MFVDPNIPVEGGNSLKRFIHSVCYFGDKCYKVQYVDKKYKTIYLIESRKKQSWLIVALKVLACATVLIPALVWIHHKFSSTKYRLYQYPIDQFSIHDLPLDCLRHVFSFLDFIEQINPTQVNNLWNQKIQEASKSEQIQLVENLIKKLSPQLQPEVIQDCIAVVNKFRKQKSDQLIDLKNFLIDLKFDLAVILFNKINHPDKFFKTQILPQFFEDFADLFLYKNLYPQLIQRQSWSQVFYLVGKLEYSQQLPGYKDLTEKLLIEEKYDLILDLIPEIDPKLDITSIIWQVQEVFLKREDFNRAFAVTVLAKDRLRNRSYASLRDRLDNIFVPKVRSFLFNKQYDSVFNLVEKYEKDTLCIEIINILLLREHVDEAIQFVNNLKNGSLQSDGFFEICKVLCHRLEFEKASGFAHRITNFKKNKAYETIVKSLLASHDVQDVLEIASRLNIPFTEQSLALDLIDALLNKDCIDKAIEIANSFPIKDRFNLDLIILDALVKNGQSEKALAYVNPEYPEFEIGILKLAIWIDSPTSNEIVEKIYNTLKELPIVPISEEATWRSKILCQIERYQRCQLRFENIKEMDDAQLDELQKKLDEIQKIKDTGFDELKRDIVKLQLGLDCSKAQLIKEKRFEEAVKIAKEHPNDLIREQMLGNIAIEWYNDDSTQAELLVNSIQNESIKASYLARICIERREFEKAFEMSRDLYFDFGYELAHSRERKYPEIELKKAVNVFPFVFKSFYDLN